MQDFRRLKVWEKAYALTLDVYHVSQCFPRDEIYGLTSQMRRAAVSIGANVAAGSCRSGDSEFRRFLSMAIGSASELEYELLLANDLRMMNQSDFDRLSNEAVEVKRMLASLICRLTSKLKADG